MEVIAISLICFTLMVWYCYSPRERSNKDNAISSSEQHEWHTIRDCLKAIRIDPNNAEVHFYMGIAYGALEDYSEAISCYQAAARLGLEASQTWLRDKGYSW